MVSWTFNRKIFKWISNRLCGYNLSHRKWWLITSHKIIVLISVGKTYFWILIRDNQVCPENNQQKQPPVVFLKIWQNSLENTSVGVSFLIKLRVSLTVCSYHVTHAFQSESTLYSCLNVKNSLLETGAKSEV